MAHLTASVSQIWTDRRFGDELTEAFSGSFTAAYLSVGFVNASGVRHVAAAPSDFRSRGGTVQAVVGVDGPSMRPGEPAPFNPKSLVHTERPFRK